MNHVPEYLTQLLLEVVVYPWQEIFTCRVTQFQFTLTWPKHVLLLLPHTVCEKSKPANPRYSSSLRVATLAKGLNTFVTSTIFVCIFFFFLFPIPYELIYKLLIQNPIYFTYFDVIQIRLCVFLFFYFFTRTLTDLRIYQVYPALIQKLLRLICMVKSLYWLISVLQR